MKYSFYEWAKFGLEVPQPKPKQVEDEYPTERVNIEYITQQVSKHNLGIKESTENYFGELQWGDQPGAVKIQFTPYGGLRAIFRKLAPDLNGIPRWVCKHVLEVRHKYDKKPDTLISDVLHNLNEIDQHQIDAPSNTFADLEKLVLNMAGKLKLTRTDLFFFEGIRRTIENQDYSIHFGVHGHGVQAQDQKRLDEFMFHVYYDKNAGFIKIIGQEVNGPIRRHDWALDQSEWIEYYMPSQAATEIINSQINLFKSY